MISSRVAGLCLLTLAACSSGVEPECAGDSAGIVTASVEVGVEGRTIGDAVESIRQTYGSVIAATSVPGMGGEAPIEITFAPDASPDDLRSVETALKELAFVIKTAISPCEESA